MRDIGRMTIWMVLGDLSGRTEPTILESGGMAGRMDKALFAVQTEGNILEKTKMIDGMVKELYGLQTGESMLETLKTATFMEKGLNTLLTDRYQEREYGQTISILEKDSCIS